MKYTITSINKRKASGSDNKSNKKRKLNIYHVPHYTQRKDDLTDQYEFISNCIQAFDNLDIPSIKELQTNEFWNMENIENIHINHKEFSLLSSALNNVNDNEKLKKFMDIFNFVKFSDDYYKKCFSVELSDSEVLSNQQQSIIQLLHNIYFRCTLDEKICKDFLIFLSSKKILIDLEHALEIFKDCIEAIPIHAPESNKYNFEKFFAKILEHSIQSIKGTPKDLSVHSRSALRASEGSARRDEVAILSWCVHNMLQKINYKVNSKYFDIIKKSIYDIFDMLKKNGINVNSLYKDHEVNKDITILELCIIMYFNNRELCLKYLNTQLSLTDTVNVKDVKNKPNVLTKEQFLLFVSDKIITIKDAFEIILKFKDIKIKELFFFELLHSSKVSNQDFLDSKEIIYMILKDLVILTIENPSRACSSIKQRIQCDISKYKNISKIFDFYPDFINDLKMIRNTVKTEKVNDSLSFKYRMLHEEWTNDSVDFFFE